MRPSKQHKHKQEEFILAETSLHPSLQAHVYSIFQENSGTKQRSKDPLRAV